MAQVNVYIDGLERIMTNLTHMGVDAKKAIMDGMKTSGKQIQGSAKRLCPVDTGELRNSITVEEIPDGVSIGTNCEYAVYVEFGTGIHGDPSVPHTTKTHWTYKRADTGQFVTTSGQPPQPYLHPAMIANMNNVKTIIKSSLTRALANARRR